ncbi:MAG: phage head closure protein [Hyphomonadaceae bacterium]
MSDAISALRARVTLQEPVRVPDELGGAAIFWAARGEVWAAIEPRGALERVTGDASVSAAALRATIRRRDDVQHGWRIAWGSRLLRVLGRDDAGGTRIVLYCQEEIL